MTKKDIFIQIISEVSGKSIDLVTELINLVADKKLKLNWNNELPDEEADELLEALRKEKAGILNWLVQGYVMGSNL